MHCPICDNVGHPLPNGLIWFPGLFSGGFFCTAPTDYCTQFGAAPYKLYAAGGRSCVFYSDTFFCYDCDGNPTTYTYLAVHDPPDPSEGEFADLWIVMLIQGPWHFFPGDTDYDTIVGNVCNTWSALFTCTPGVYPAGGWTLDPVSSDCGCSNSSGTLYEAPP